MDTSKLYILDFPKEHEIEDIDVVDLYHSGKLEELYRVIVCKDSYGNVTATFGDNRWDCIPFSRNKQKNSLDFNHWNNHPKLQLEMKLLAFGWLFNKNPRGRKALSFTGCHSRLTDLKIACQFLRNNQLESLGALSDPVNWSNFEDYLKSKNYSQSTVRKAFIAINASIWLEPWHQLNLGLMLVQSSIRTKAISDRDGQQTLVIPEQLCDSIYGKAIDLVNAALPHKQIIADVEADLQSNYLKGKAKVERKIQQGRTFAFMDERDEIKHHKLALTITDNQPQKPKDIIAPLREKVKGVPLRNGSEFQRYLGQLITSCYVICGGFSGMRDSELDKLTPNSYYMDVFEGRTFHMLQSHTFKLGEKRETWVTASSSKQAIELMSELTKHWRKNTKYPDDAYANSLWVNHGARSQRPKLITDWNHRLKRFCKQFNFIVTNEDYQECIRSNPNSIARVNKEVKVGKPWPMTTHQFRRTLAFYCIQKRLSTVVALKQQFKHLYLTMTEWYTNGGRVASLLNLTTDKNIQQTLDNINVGMIANKIFQQWHSDEKLSGSHGKAILKMRGDTPHIYSSWDIIYKAVKDGELTLHGTAHSYCKSGYDCDMDGVVTPQFCVDCSSGSSIIDEQQAKWWQKKHRSLVAYMALGNDISVSERSHYITQIRAAENVMSDFDMEFSPFEAELRIAGNL
ncbi:hypothetical protein AB4582_16165 [Vibrio splendidus]